jgi:hypothetical protein
MLTIGVGAGEPDSASIETVVDPEPGAAKVDAGKNIAAGWLLSGTVRPHSKERHIGGLFCILWWR